MHFVSNPILANLAQPIRGHLPLRPRLYHLDCQLGLYRVDWIEYEYPLGVAL